VFGRDTSRFDGLVGRELGGQFPEAFAGGVGHAGGLLRSDGFRRCGCHVGAAHRADIADPSLVVVVQQAQRRGVATSAPASG
jgi:hypothetical protein